MLERFLNRQIYTFGPLLAEANVKAQVGLRSFVDQQAQPAAAGGGEAVEEMLIVLETGHRGRVEKGNHPQQPILRQRCPILDLTVCEPFASELTFGISARGAAIGIQTRPRQIQKRRHSSDDEIGESPERDLVTAVA